MSEQDQQNKRVTEDEELAQFLEARRSHLGPNRDSVDDADDVEAWDRYTRAIERLREVSNLQSEKERLERVMNQIAAYCDPDSVKDDSDGVGLDEDEAVEMAYENVLALARRHASK